jgi:hypothetical protein
MVRLPERSRNLAGTVLIVLGAVLLAATWGGRRG